MKKLFTVLLMVAVAAALSVCSFAISRGDAYIEDHGYFNEKVRCVAPGDTVYIALAEAENEETDFEISRSMTPSSAKVTSAKTEGFIDDKNYKMIETGSLDIEKLPVEDGCDWYFAELEIDDIDIDDYPEDGFDVSGTLKVSRKGGSTFTVDLGDTISFIRYAVADDEDELSSEPQLYQLDQDTEFELAFPNENGWFSGETKSDIAVVASMSHDEISSIAKLDRDADLTFYLGNGVRFPYVRDAQLVIEADDGYYLYKIGNGNSLSKVSNAYDEDEEAFIIETNVLGKYVVSDTRLSTSASSDDDDDDDDDDEVDDVYVYEGEDDDVDETPNIYVPLLNPTTGAVA